MSHVGVIIIIFSIINFQQQVLITLCGGEAEDDEGSLLLWHALDLILRMVGHTMIP